MRKALLVSESTVYKNPQGEMIAHGGGEVYMHNLAKLLLKLGIESTVFGIKEFEGQISEEVIDGVLYKRGDVRSRRSFLLLKYLKEARKLARKFDLVFVNQFVPHLILPFIRGKKRIAIIHDVYKKEGLKFWIKQYGFFAGVSGWMVEKLQLFFDKRYADFIVTVSESSKKKIGDVIGSKVFEKLLVCPSIVYKRDDLKDVQKEKIILFVGRFVDYKHPEQGLLVLKKVQEFDSEYKAIFVATRVSKKTMQLFKKVKKEQSVDDESVIIKSDCGNEEVAELMAKAKILVHSSYIEGQGIVILEALSLGTPIVAYNLEAYKGMLLNGQNCELTQKGEVSRLSEGAVKILKNYDFYQKNCKTSLEEFSEEKVMNVLKNID
jgi:glycosyltransferase involved in cell wall biosynthesis